MSELIPFQVEAQRVIQLLAKQIYQSPLALLRENAQNAYDAILQRLAIDRTFSPQITIQLSPDQAIISDNGIGMTSTDLQQHYWTAGSSSKNNDLARAAGVVGTFGIGAMANFGIADSLFIETESAITGERTICRAEKSKLSLKDNCIELEIGTSQGQPGTMVLAKIAPDSLIDVSKARDYIAEFVSLVEVPVYVNGELASQKNIDKMVAAVSETWRLNRESEKLGKHLTADIELALSNNADIWLKLTNIYWAQEKITGRIVLRSGQTVLRTFRSGFGLATASVSSTYHFGGIVDLLVLEPTAGREAITVDGLQFLQSMMIEIDELVSNLLSTRDEADVSTPFMSWVVAHDRFDLCGRLRMAIVPGDRIELQEVANRSKLAPMALYDGLDAGVIRTYASEASPLLIVARKPPRRRCERQYLRSHAKVQAIADRPAIADRRKRNEMSTSESALAFRIETILESDYFLSCEIDFGEITHGVPVLVEKLDGIKITLNSKNQTVKLILDLYGADFSAFGSMAKDFVRTVIFHRISEYVPSSTRQGAEAFLKAIQRPRETFEFSDRDLGSLPEIWTDYDEGKITLDQAVERSRSAVRSSVQVVDRAERASDVVPDIIQNEEVLRNIEETEVALDLDPSPAIIRTDATTSSKLLVVEDGEPTLRGYRCFLAITDKVRTDFGEFFMQPHRTSIVWGGQKILFIFVHHSEQFGLYYDLQAREPVSSPAGGGPFPTATIILKDRLFIPIPDIIYSTFVPALGERKRFDVRADILRTDDVGRESAN